MAFDENLAARVRALLASERGLTERRMFGGLCFLIHGNMVAGVLGSDLILRVGAEACDAALARPHVHPFDLTGRPSKGTVYVQAAALRTTRALTTWLAPVVKRIAAAPPKPRSGAPKPSSAKVRTAKRRPS